MRTQLFVAFAMSSLVACGGEDAPATPDAKVYMDAPPDMTPACTVMSDLGSVAYGTMQMRRAGDFISTLTSGPLTGRTVFAIGIGLPGGSDTAVDVLFFQVLKPMTDDFTTGSAISFETNPAASTFNAVAYVAGDYNPQAKTIAQLLYAGSGAITLENIGESDGSQITGSVNATSYREINQMTGADIAGGCTANLTGFSFALTQMNAPFAPGKLSTDELGLTPADTAFLLDQVTRLTAPHGQQ